MLSPTNTLLRRFRRARGGNVAITFGLALFPMALFMGLGVDVSRTISAKTTFDAAADAAALAAATAAETTIQNSGSSPDHGAAQAQIDGNAAGQSMFSADAEKAGNWAGGTPTPTITVPPVTGQIITATVTYSADVPTVFGGMVGVSTMRVAGTAKSSLSLPKYLNISVAIDVSQSMGLAATNDDMTKLKALTSPASCAFGCHVYQPGQTGSDPYEVLAHKNNIQLRIDVIRSATQNMIQTAKAIQGSASLISFGLYTLQGGAPYTSGQAFSTLSQPSRDYDALNTAAQGIDLGPNNGNGVGDTNFPDAMPALAAVVPTSGDGTDSTHAQQFVFLMTDGVQDVGNGTVNCTNNVWGHCTGPLDVTQCSAMKAKGITIGVIYTTYLAMPDRAEYTNLVQSWAGQIPQKLQACASSGYYYEANEGPEIQAAINSLFAKATGSGVLIQ